MLNSTEILAEALGQRLGQVHSGAFSRRGPRHAEIIAASAMRSTTSLLLSEVGVTVLAGHAGTCGECLSSQAEHRTP